MTFASTFSHVPGTARRLFSWLTAVGVLLALAGAETAHAQGRARLLFSDAELARIRHACGTARAPSEGYGKFGRHSADYETLRRHFLYRPEGDVLPGEALAAAFLYRIEPDSPDAAARVRVVEDALRSVSLISVDRLEQVIALDWTWEAVSPDVRRAFLLRARDWARPMAPGDSPLDRLAYPDRLAALALAIVADDERTHGESWAALRSRILEAGRNHLGQTLPTFVSWRGLSPTGPAVGPWVERDTALAVELGRHLLADDPWKRQDASVGRWMEHYLYIPAEHPALRHDYLRDDARRAPVTPVPEWERMLPVTAHLIAARTGDPAAARVAFGIAQSMAQSDDLLTRLWRWVPIVFDISDVPPCDTERLPVARNFGGAVALRAGRGPGTTGVWIEAGQPFLRRRQHFDAGHFLMYHGGHLANDAAADVYDEAVASYAGGQFLGQRDPFDFEQFCTSTIAHNGLVVWDAARVQDWYGARYLPSGGQRPIDETCHDFALSLDAQKRTVGHQIAYGSHDGNAYVALDLAPAYDGRTVKSYVREFVFLFDRVLVVVDRVQQDSTRTSPTWVLQAPTRPHVDGADLSPDCRVAGKSNTGGIWACPDAKRLSWTERDGRLWVIPLEPTPRRLSVIGGPGETQRIKDGPEAGRRYYGGTADGYERLILPADRYGNGNAWYSLGRPPVLGKMVGIVPHWGRVEIEPAQHGTRFVFITVLAADAATSDSPPEVHLARDGDQYVVHIACDSDQRATLRLVDGLSAGGSLDIAGQPASTWELPRKVMEDPPLPTVAAGARTQPAR